MSFNYSEPLIIDWITDGGGNKVSLPVTNEQQVVVNSTIVLDYIPDAFYGVTSNSATPTTEIRISQEITLNTQ